MTFLPVTCARRCSICLARSADKGRAVVTSARIQPSVLAQTFPIGGQQVRQDDEPVAIREQRQQLGENRGDAECRRELRDRGALARHGHGRVEHDFFERRVLSEQVHELDQLRLDLVEVLLLPDSDIKERASVTMSGGFAGHPVNILPTRGVQELAKTFTSAPTLYHSHGPTTTRTALLQ